MSRTFDQGKDEVAKLCQFFATNQHSFRAPNVKEAHVRQSLINPFFEALGWDVRNNSMAAPQYREVIPEDSLDVEGHQKAPDYTFRVGTLPKFYVEAKKCGVNISTDPGSAYQLRRYGFSAKLPLSILTDFEEFSVYDCSSRPRPGDKASHARIQYLDFTEYPDRWREIWDVFSREAVWSGAFDKYAASKRKRGTSEVDSEFLKDIEGWRDVLARNLALRNSDLSVDDLNAAVQRIIDRIVFLRMAEDRRLESYGRLLRLCERPHIYDRFMSELCRKADEKYNSGLFHFQKEPGISDAPDTLTPRLTVDDKVLKLILQSLYFEYGCPYHFGVLPVEILGTVYERFLGKVIRLTAGHKAKVEEKPEVRKAGGVYYTPAYIVNYIVQNTVGKQIEGKSPAKLSGGKTKPPFRVLDMACGSGSFLIGAYQFLLEHCLKWYLHNPTKKYAKATYRDAKGELHLTIEERKRILITHIYGVDIDRQAVETTKLSLLLKALEGENDATLSQQMLLFHERALPNLSHNIKCGNSLIASDFSMDPEDLVRVHAFDWPAQFPDAIKAGGFDTVIGNPPYLYSAGQDNIGYFQSNFQFSEYQTDFYVYFIEKAIKLTKPQGLLSFIVSDSWLKAENFSKLRKHLLTEHRLNRLAIFQFPPFAGATIENSILVVSKNGKPMDIPIDSFSEPEVFRQINIVSPSVAANRGLVDPRFSNKAEKLIQKLELHSSHLESITEINRGIHAYRTDGYGKSKFGPGPQTKRDKEEQSYHAKSPLNKTYLPELKGKNVFRFESVPSGDFVSYGNWLAESRQPKYFLNPKIALRKVLGKKLHGTFLPNPVILDQSLYVMISTSNDEDHLKFLLGILLSSVGAWYLRTKFAIYDTLYPWYTRKQLASFPIKGENPCLVELVEKMLVLMPKLREATSESEKAALQNAITTTDAEIDRLVYELYGLTEEEIKIVEGECCR